MMEQRLSNLQSTEDIFDVHKAPYEQALEKSGYKKALEKSEYVYELKYQNSRKKRKPRNIIYFNAPFSKDKCGNIVPQPNR